MPTFMNEVYFLDYFKFNWILLCLKNLRFLFLWFAMNTPIQSTYFSECCLMVANVFILKCPVQEMIMKINCMHLFVFQIIFKQKGNPKFPLITLYQRMFALPQRIRVCFGSTYKNVSQFFDKSFLFCSMNTKRSYLVPIILNYQ